MLPAQFDYIAASSVEEAIAAKAEGGDETRFLAGGQSLLPMMKLRFATPSKLVDVNRIAGLDAIEHRNGHLHVGALVRPADIAASAGRCHDPATQITEWIAAVGKGVPGYVTPKVAVGAVVSDDDGRVLLIRRADSGYWLYPTGWADVGYSSSEIAVKEVAEETGIDCEPVRLIAVLDSMRHGFTSVPTYSLVYHCRAVGGELRAHPVECTGVGFFSQDDLPSPLAGPDIWADHAFSSVRGEVTSVLFDAPREPLWRAQT